VEYDVENHVPNKQNSLLSNAAEGNILVSAVQVQAPPATLDFLFLWPAEMGSGA
jgi:hypothetical protein